MPRTPRVEYAGAVYHVMCRGDRRERIVRDQEDYRWMERTLGEVCERTGWRIHSYVVMPNHYHILLETPEANLVAGMKWFQGTYTVRFNTRNHEGGHVFQGRYKALVLDKDEPEYFRVVSDYIHLNPARAGLLGREEPKLLDYPWSSYRAYVGLGSRPPWLETRQVLSSHGLDDDRAGRKAYMEYLAGRVVEIQEGDQRKLEAEWKAVRRGWYLGGPEFRSWLVGLLGGVMKGKQRTSFSGEGVRGHDERAAEALLERGLTALRWSETEARAARKNDVRKQGLIWLMRTRTVVSAEWINRRLNVGHASNISRALQAMSDSPTRHAEEIRRVMLKCKD